MSSRFFILQSEDVEQKFTTVHHCRHFAQEETGQASRRGRAPGGGGQSCAWEKFRFVETSQGGACSPTRQVWALPCPSAALRGPGQPPSQAPGLAHVAVLVTSLPRGDSSVAVGPASQSCTWNSSRTGGWEAQGPRVLGVVPRSWQPAPRPCVAVMPGLGQAGPGLTAGGRVLRGRQAAPAPGGCSPSSGCAAREQGGSWASPSAPQHGRPPVAVRSLWELDGSGGGARGAGRCRGLGGALGRSFPLASGDPASSTLLLPSLRWGSLLPWK